VRVAAMRDPAVRQIVRSSESRERDNEKAMRLLGWSPRSKEDSIVATAESLLRLGLLKNGAHTRRRSPHERPVRCRPYMARTSRPHDSSPPRGAFS